MRLSKRLVLATLLCTCTLAQASGFEVQTQAARHLSLLYAGRSAIADDPSTVWFNPAGLVRLPGIQQMDGISFIFANREWNDGGSTTGGAPLSGETGRNGHQPGYPGYLYLSAKLEEDVGFGIGLNFPFGLEVDYGDSWPGRYYASDSRLITINLHPALATRITDKWSIGVGVNAQLANANIANNIDFGTIGAGLGLTPQMSDGRVRLKADAFDFGFNAGVLYEHSPRTRIGLHYRHDIGHDLTGHADFRVPPEANPLTAGGAFMNTRVRARIVTPAQTSLSFYHELNDRWAIVGDITWTQWSRIRSLTIFFDNPAQPTASEPRNWTDPFKYSLGAIFRLNEKWTLRFSSSYEESPVREALRDVRTPDEDRIHAAIGFSYDFHDGKRAIDFGYSFTWKPRAHVNLDAPARGNLVGDFEEVVHVVAIAFVRRF